MNAKVTTETDLDNAFFSTRSFSSVKLNKKQIDSPNAVSVSDKFTAWPKQ